MPRPRSEDKSVTINIYLPLSLLQRLDDEAERRGISRSAVIREAVEAALETPPAPADREGDR